MYASSPRASPNVVTEGATRTESTQYTGNQRSEVEFVPDGSARGASSGRRYRYWFSFSSESLCVKISCLGNPSRNLHQFRGAKSQTKVSTA